MLQIEMFNHANPEKLKAEVNEWLASKPLGLDDVRLFYAPTSTNKTSMGALTPNERHNMVVLYQVKGTFGEQVRVIDEMQVQEVSLTNHGYELGGVVETWQGEPVIQGEGTHGSEGTQENCR